MHRVESSPSCRTRVNELTHFFRFNICVVLYLSHYTKLYIKGEKGRRGVNISRLEEREGRRIVLDRAK